MSVNLRHLWQRANARYWHGVIPMPRFSVRSKLADDPNCAAIYWRGQRYHCVRLFGEPMPCFAVLAYTVVHEQIHAAQSIARRPLGHDAFFQFHHVRIFGWRYVSEFTEWDVLLWYDNVGVTL